MARCSCRGGRLRRMRRSAASRTMLRWRLILQKPVKDDDEAGGETVSWQDHAVLFAALVPVCGNAETFADAESSYLVWEVRLRWRQDIQAGDRLVRSDGGILTIQTVHDPDGRRRFLICRCLERPL